MVFYCFLHSLQSTFGFPALCEGILVSHACVRYFSLSLAQFFISLTLIIISMLATSPSRNEREFERTSTWHSCFSYISIILRAWTLLLPHREWIFNSRIKEIKIIFEKKRKKNDINFITCNLRKKKTFQKFLKKPVNETYPW